MKKLLFCAVMLLVTAVLTNVTFAGSYPLKREITPKREYTNLPKGADLNRVVFKLKEGIGPIDVTEGRFNYTGKQWDRLNDILSAGGRVESIERRIKLNKSLLDQMRLEGSQRIGWQLPDMSLYFEIQIKEGLPKQEILNLINRLNGLDLIEIAYFSPLIEVPPVDIDTDVDLDAKPGVGETPNWENRQYYLQPAPLGLDAYYGWSFPGGRGESVMAIDIESAWTESHEDLHGGTDSFLIGGEVDYEDYNSLGHGTAVVGIIAADSNSFGTTGISYNVDLGTYGVITDYPYLSSAILTVSNVAEEGDIILVEFQMYTSDESTVVAMEYLQENFDAILTVSALGRILVEPAANGNANYDDIELFDSLFYPDYRFSGAIMVGDCYADHVPTNRTCHGQRVDVHAFGGYDVYTHGWGFLFGDNPDNYYTAWFSGTSAASPQIVGACAILQGIHKELYGTTLNHNDMRSLLTTYSTPQADHYKRIGPMPDLAGSCNAITGFIRPAQPVLVSPDDGAFFETPVQPVLDWDDVSGAISYDVMIDDNKDFISPLQRQDGLMATQWTTPPLDPGQYFWRVRANKAEGFGAWSQARKFRVDIGIAAPVLYSPINNERVIYREPPRFAWAPIEGVTDYLIEVDYLPDFTSPYKRFAFSLPCEGDTCLTYVYLPGGTRYYWRVKALGDEWPWSEIQWFSLIGELHINEPKGPPQKAAITESTGSVELIGNYPNPFNPSTEISFSLPHASYVNLEIFNIVGQRVSTLVDGHLNTGVHTVIWDGSRAASGVYLYRLRAGDIVESRKMLLLK